MIWTKQGVVACSYNATTLEAHFWDCVDSTPVGDRCLSNRWMDFVTSFNPSHGEEPGQILGPNWLRPNNEWGFIVGLN